MLTACFFAYIPQRNDTHELTNCVRWSFHTTSVTHKTITAFSVDVCSRSDLGSRKTKLICTFRLINSMRKTKSLTKCHKLVQDYPPPLLCCCLRYFDLAQCQLRVSRFSSWGYTRQWFISRYQTPKWFEPTPTLTMLYKGDVCICVPDIWVLEWNIR